MTCLVAIFVVSIALASLAYFSVMMSTIWLPALVPGRVSKYLWPRIQKIL